MAPWPSGSVNETQVLLPATEKATFMSQVQKERKNDGLPCQRPSSLPAQACGHYRDRGRGLFFLSTYLTSFWHTRALSIYFSSFWQAQALPIHLSSFQHACVRTSPCLIWASGGDSLALRLTVYANSCTGLLLTAMFHLCGL